MCARCSRLCAAESEVLCAPCCVAKVTGTICTHSPAALPLTQRLAGLSITRFGELELPGVVPISTRRSMVCGAPPCEVYPADLSHPVAPSHPDGSVSPEGACRMSSLPLWLVSMVSLNCGGITGKLDQVIALLDWWDAYVVCLQELWDTFHPEDLQLPHCTLFCSGLRPRGEGLAVLLHQWLLANLSSPPEGRNTGHGQSIRLRVPSGFLTVINVHIRPGASPSEWDDTRQFVANHLEHQGTQVLFVCGDFNEDLSTARGRVGVALKQRRPWHHLYCPYSFGDATNVVSRQGMISPREIDYVLVHRCDELPQVTVSGCFRSVLHSRCYARSSLSSSLFWPYSAVQKSRSGHCGNTFTACWPFLLAITIRWKSIDDYHGLALQLIPPYGSRASRAEASMLQALTDGAARGDAASKCRLDEWFTNARDQAFRAGLDVRKTVIHSTKCDVFYHKLFYFETGLSAVCPCQSRRPLLPDSAQEIPTRSSTPSSGIIWSPPSACQQSQARTSSVGMDVSPLR